MFIHLFSPTSTAWSIKFFCEVMKENSFNNFFFLFYLCNDDFSYFFCLPFRGVCVIKCNKIINISMTFDVLFIESGNKFANDSLVCKAFFKILIAIRRRSLNYNVYYISLCSCHRWYFITDLRNICSQIFTDDFLWELLAHRAKCGFFKLGWLSFRVRGEGIIWRNKTSTNLLVLTIPCYSIIHLHNIKQKYEQFKQ